MTEADALAPGTDPHASTRATACTRCAVVSPQRMAPGRRLCLQGDRPRHRVPHHRQTRWALTDPAHSDLPCVQPDTQFQDVSRLALAVETSFVHPPLQLQGCQHGAFGMVLLGHRRAKDSRNALTQHRLYGAPIPLRHIPGQGRKRTHLAVPCSRLPRRAPRRGFGQPAT